MHKHCITTTTKPFIHKHHIRKMYFHNSNLGTAGFGGTIPAVISPAGPATCKLDPSFVSLSCCPGLSFVDFKLPLACSESVWGLEAYNEKLILITKANMNSVSHDNQKSIELYTPLRI
jgi:hypothetical protein